MKGFDLFVNKYPPGNDLRKPAAEMLEQFQGKLPTELLDFCRNTASEIMAEDC